MLDYLPPEIISHIIKYLDLKNTTNLRLTSKYYYNFLTTKELFLLTVKLIEYFYKDKCYYKVINYIVPNCIFCPDCSIIIQMEELENHMAICKKIDPLPMCKHNLPRFNCICQCHSPIRCIICDCWIENSELGSFFKHIKDKKKCKHKSIILRHMF
jgi:hypothetical protein